MPARSLGGAALGLRGLASGLASGRERVASRRQGAGFGTEFSRKRIRPPQRPFMHVHDSRPPWVQSPSLQPLGASFFATHVRDPQQSEGTQSAAVRQAPRPGMSCST